MTNNVTAKLQNLNLEDRFLFDETMEDQEAYQAAVSKKGAGITRRRWTYLFWSLAVQISTCSTTAALL